MRTFFISLVLFFFIGNISVAQEWADRTRIVSQYGKDFIGTWKYESEDYFVSITFTKGLQGNTFEVLYGTYRVWMNGQYYEDLGEQVIIGGPIFEDRSERSVREARFKKTEIIFNLIDRKYFNGSNDSAFSQFYLTMLKGRTDRAVLKLVPEDDYHAGLGRSSRRPTQNLFPPDGTVLIKQKK